MGCGSNASKYLEADSCVQALGSKFEVALYNLSNALISSFKIQ